MARRRIHQPPRRDQDAVTAGLTLPWSSGIVEGNVNRLKMFKRQMFHADINARRPTDVDRAIPTGPPAES